MTPKHEKGYNEFMNLTAFEQYLSVTDQGLEYHPSCEGAEPKYKKQLANASCIRDPDWTCSEPFLTNF